MRLEAPSSPAPALGEESQHGHYRNEPSEVSSCCLQVDRQQAALSLRTDEPKGKKKKTPGDKKSTPQKEEEPKSAPGGRDKALSSQEATMTSASCVLSGGDLSACFYATDCWPT